MERNPVRFVWQNSRLLHFGAALVLLALIPLTWLVLDLPRRIVDDAVLGHVFGDRGVAQFLPLILDLPHQFRNDPLVLFEGLALQRRDYFIAGCMLLVGLVCLRALLVWLITAARGVVGRRAAHQLRYGLFRRMLVARPSARDDATLAAELSGHGIASIGPFLGDALIVPAMALSLVGVVVAYAASIDAWFGVMTLAITLSYWLVASWGAGAMRTNSAARHAREQAIARAALDAGSRSLAIRIHGTARAEEHSFSRVMARLDGVWAGFARRVGHAVMARSLLHEMGPLAMLAMAGFWILEGQLTLGGLVSLLLVVSLLPRPVAALVTWRRERDHAARVFKDIARVSGALASREKRAPGSGGKLAPPAGAKPTTVAAADAAMTGELVAEGLSALDPDSGVRLAGVDVRLALPAHVALVGAQASGAETFASLLGGGLDRSSGTLSIGGEDVADIIGGAWSGLEGHRRIAFAGGAPVVLDASLRDNLLYGARLDAQGESGVEARSISDRELVEVLTLAGIDSEVYGLGLAGNIDGAGDPSVAANVVAARRAVREALASADSANLVDPFDPTRYNDHATVAENLMFGVPVGDTFSDANLPRHPFVRAVLEAENLTSYLEQKGLAIATSMVEIFEGVPDGHPLFERFAFFSPGERGHYEELVARHAQSERRRGASALRDRERLIALAFRYVETRHRLGLLDDTLRRRVVEARGSFRSLLPPSLGAAVEFYDPAGICLAASLADNLLFGRVAHDVAGAEERVRKVVRRVLADRGLDHLVFEVGLSARLSEREPRLLAGRLVQLDIARCLVRQPRMLVVSDVVEGLGTAEAEALVERLRRAFEGRTLFLNLPDTDLTAAMDAVLTFERGSLISADGPAVKRAVQQAAAEPAEA